MGAVTDNLKLTVQEAKDYCRVDDTTDDWLIKLLITTSKEAADEFCNNDFGNQAEDGDGDLIEVGTRIPDAVKLGCLEYIAYYYDHRGEVGHGTIPEVAANHWKKYRLIPGF